MKQFCVIITTPVSASQKIQPVRNFGRGQAVVQLVETLRYASASRGFDTGCCHCGFLLYYSSPPHLPQYGPEV